MATNLELAFQEALRKKLQNKKQNNSPQREEEVMQQGEGISRVNEKLLLTYHNAFKIINRESERNRGKEMKRGVETNHRGDKQTDKNDNERGETRVITPKGGKKEKTDNRKGESMDTDKSKSTG